MTHSVAGDGDDSPIGGWRSHGDRDADDSLFYPQQPTITITPSAGAMSQPVGRDRPLSTTQPASPAPIPRPQSPNRRAFELQNRSRHSLFGENAKSSNARPLSTALRERRGSYVRQTEKSLKTVRSEDRPSTAWALSSYWTGVSNAVEVRNQSVSAALQQGTQQDPLDLLADDESRSIRGLDQKKYGHPGDSFDSNYQEVQRALLQLSDNRRKGGNLSQGALEKGKGGNKYRQKLNAAPGKGMNVVANKFNRAPGAVNEPTPALDSGEDRNQNRMTKKKERLPGEVSVSMMEPPIVRKNREAAANAQLGMLRQKRLVEARERRETVARERRQLKEAEENKKIEKAHRRLEEERMRREKAATSLHTVNPEKERLKKLQEKYRIMQWLVIVTRVGQMQRLGDELKYRQQLQRSWRSILMIQALWRSRLLARRQGKPTPIALQIERRRMQNPSRVFSP
jgi:hypothetical protein